MTPPLYISFYTLGNGYEAEARELMLSLDAFGLPCDVRGIPSAGNWQANTQAKASFVRDMLREHPGRSLVWLDADARVRQRPVLLDTIDCDVAAHWKDGWELLSATVYFSGAAASVALVDQWVEECARHPDVWDQKCLDAVVQRSPTLRVKRLPPSYSLIFDLMAEQGPAVIEQTQASRRLKT